MHAMRDRNIASESCRTGRADGTRILRCRAMLAMLFCSFPHALTAQSSQPAAGSQRVSCIDTLSLPATVPRVVYLQSAMGNSVDSRAAQMVDIYAQSVAQRIRGMLHPHGDTLPHGEPTITWREIESSTPLEIKTFRNGTPVYRLLSTGRDSVAGTILLSAARVTADSGEGPFWPDGMPGDSLVFGLAYAVSTPGKLQVATSGHIAFPAFSEMFPPETLIQQPAGSFPQFPIDLLNQGAQGTVIVDFRVDSTGRVVPQSITDVWKPGQKRPRGELFPIYNEFLQSVENWLVRAVFTPAHIGRCPVEQLTEQPFIFSITQ